MTEFFPPWMIEYWGLLTGGVVVAAGILASLHVVLSQREVRSAIGWLGLILLVPLLGASLYAVFGVNRIRRTAVTLRGGHVRRYRIGAGALERSSGAAHDDPGGASESGGGDSEIGGTSALDPVPRMARLAALGAQVTGRPLLAGNRIRPLLNGDEAYPEMLAAIAGARRSVTLLTYIFDVDAVGERFVEALENAARRGVEVRVLVDAAGSRYSSRRVDRELARRGVTARRFMPLRLGQLRFLNLRNHRKILVIDGTVGFTGGMNLRAGHVLTLAPNRPVRDVHFRVEGPVVGQLQEVFAEDWEFTTGESLEGDAWFPILEGGGPTLARGIADGPDEDLDVLNWVLLGAISAARDTVRVMTPYFLPDPPLATALNVAALRGVRVDIVVPERTNVLPVRWAMWGDFWNVIDRGCRLWLTPEPFDHTKLVLVDDHWVLFGSTNWDPRSLRLNFEFNVETYCDELSASVASVIDDRIASARRLTPRELKSRRLPLRIRDGIARLLSPYL